MKAEFSKTVDILVKAYLNDTLKHGNCYACAVGNIIADNMGFEFCKDDASAIKSPSWKGQLYPAFSEDGQDVNGWGAAFYTSGWSGKQYVKKQNLLKEPVIKQIESTGYHWSDLAKIESAFETANKGQSEDEYMFNGLMAVVDVLAKIHKVDRSEKESAKKLFHKLEI